MIFRKNHLRQLVILLLLFSSYSFAIPDPDDDGGSAAWIAQYNVSSSFAKVGKPVNVQWQSFFSVGCGLWTNQTGSRAVSTSGNTTVTPNSASTMSVRLSCTGTNGRSTSQTRSFSVNRADHPELLSLNVSRTTAQAGESITLSWSSNFSNYCQLSGTNSDTLPTSGSRSYIVRTGANNFNMVCKRYDGRTSNPRSKTVTGQNTPIIIYFESSDSGPGNPNYILYWDSIADSCRLDGVPVSTRGSQFRQKQQFPRLHTLACIRNGVIDLRNELAPAFSIIGRDDPILDYAQED